MFSWGEDFKRSFRLKKGSAVPPATDAVQTLGLAFHVADLCVGLRVLAFIKNSGQASVIRVSLDAAGSRQKGKQKFVKCDQSLKAVSCTDDGVTLLSDKGVVFCVDATRPPYVPRSLEALRDIRVAQVACGSQHTVVLSEDGQVYTWGQDSRGQLGLGLNGSGISSPQHLQSLSTMPLVQVSAGGEQSFALSVSGSVFGWGRNDCGQLGLGHTTDKNTPTLVHYLNMKKIIFTACGRDHTAVLTMDGAVFTFGSGQYGQLGHNSFVNELCPRLVAELWGAKVTKIACGRYHTLVLTDHMKVYSFGCNEQGQLGPRQEDQPCVPLPVQLPQGTTDGPIIQSIFAGGDSSFATLRPDQQKMRSELKSGPKQDVIEAAIESLVDKWISEWDDTKLHPKVKQEIHQIFSSASLMNRKFLNPSKHFQTSGTYSGLDLPLCKNVFKKLMQKEAIQVEKAVMKMLPSLHKNPAGIEGLRVFLILNELLYAMQRSRHARREEIAVKVAAIVQSLSTENLQTLANWWALSTMKNKSRHVEVWKTALSEVLIMPVPHIKDILQILQNMYNVNKKKMKIPETTFCLEIDQLFLWEDLSRWRSHSRFMDVNNPPLILCSFAFVMDFKSKQWAFQQNSRLTMREHLQERNFNYFLGFPDPTPSNFQLNLRRSSLVEDSFRQLAAAPPTDIKKGLVVYFDGDTKITQVYIRDFFHHFFPEIKKEKSEMFMINDSETLVWFSIKEPEKIKADAYLFGLLCGLALYNEYIFPVQFPLVLFKKLLGVKPTLEDMMEFCPEVGKSLQYIKNYEDDDLENHYMFFEITWKDTHIDLDPENPGKPVTSQNKEEFVDAYVNYVFNISVESVFQEFERGFFQLCDRDLLSVFEPEELQRLMVGHNDYDWEKLKQNTQYVLPLSAKGDQEACFDSHLENPTMKMFWEVFDELTEDQKRDFLWFVTGSRKAPILGMGQIQMTVQLKIITRGSPDEHFPESLTCHNILDLPSYSSKEIMMDRLTQALKAERTFSNEEERPSV